MTPKSPAPDLTLRRSMARMQPSANGRSYVSSVRLSTKAKTSGIGLPPGGMRLSQVFALREADTDSAAKPFSGSRAHALIRREPVVPHGDCMAGLFGHCHLNDT